MLQQRLDWSITVRCDSFILCTLVHMLTFIHFQQVEVAQCLGGISSVSKLDGKNRMYFILDLYSLYRRSNI